VHHQPSVQEEAAEGLAGGRWLVLDPSLDVDDVGENLVLGREAWLRRGGLERVELGLEVSLLGHRLRAAYRSDERTVDLGAAANESTKEGSPFDVNDYRRATVVLLLAGCKFTVKWTEEGVPESVTVKDGILDLLGEEDAPRNGRPPDG
jgi:hypothetical protein